MARLLIAFFPNQQIFLIIDDTIIYRNSKKAPGSKINHEHGRKANRPKYARGQNWISLACAVKGHFLSAAIPLLFRMMRVSGNTSKLDAAKTLLLTILPVLLMKMSVFLGSWYTRVKLILY